MDFGDFMQDDPNESYHSYNCKMRLMVELTSVLAHTKQIKSEEMRIALMDQIAMMVSFAPPLDRDYVYDGEDDSLRSSYVDFYNAVKMNKNWVKLYDDTPSTTAEPFIDGLDDLFPDS